MSNIFIYLTLWQLRSLLHEFFFSDKQPGNPPGSQLYENSLKLDLQTLFILVNNLRLLTQVTENPQCKQTVPHLANEFYKFWCQALSNNTMPYSSHKKINEWKATFLFSLYSQILPTILYLSAFYCLIPSPMLGSKNLQGWFMSNKPIKSSSLWKTMCSPQSGLEPLSPSLPCLHYFT